MSNSAFKKTSVSLDSPVFTTKITTPVLVGGSGSTATLTIKGTSSGTTTSSIVALQPTGGNVGIGMLTPQGPLNVHVNATADDAVGGSIILNRYFSCTANQRGAAIFNYRPAAFAQDALAFAVSDSTTPLDISKVRMVIGVCGNVGIGTKSPAYKLDVNGSANINGTLNVLGGNAISLNNIYANNIYTGIWSANPRSGLISETNGKMTFANNGGGFGFRWMYSSGGLDYSGDAGQIMSLSTTGALAITGVNIQRFWFI